MEVTFVQNELGETVKVTKIGNTESRELYRPAPDVEDPAEWYITIGAFFDRFGTEKMAILSSADLQVQALIKDASVRKYIDLRRADVAGAVAMLQAKGFNINVSSVLTKPTNEELYRG